MLNRRLRGAMVACAAATIVTTVASPTLAQTSADTVRACYVPSSGTIYRVQATGTPTACAHASHVAFSFNMYGPEGPKGDPGDKGDKGDKGDTGNTGAPGVSGWQLVTATCENATSTCTLDVVCPTGKKVLGGGFRKGGGTQWEVHESIPFDDGSAWGVVFTATVASPSPATHSASAICASVP